MTLCYRSLLYAMLCLRYVLLFICVCSVLNIIINIESEFKQVKKLLHSYLFSHINSTK